MNKPSLPEETPSVLHSTVESTVVIIYKPKTGPNN